jgi:hypothetical protein
MNSVEVRSMVQGHLMDAKAALKAICSTGRGSSWYCDQKVPAVAEAIRSGWTCGA